MKSIALVILFIYAVFSGFVRPAEKAVLRLRLSGIHTIKGEILVTVFNQANGFPSKTKNAFKILKVPVSSNNQYIEIKDLPFGKYAISAVHDENSNGIMDVNILGIPKERYGASNNARNTFSPPSFDDAAFVFSKPEQVLAFVLK